jgi:hypothetical protein
MRGKTVTTRITAEIVYFHLRQKRAALALTAYSHRSARNANSIRS